MQRFGGSLKFWAAAALSAALLELPFPLAGPLPATRSVFAWFALAPLLWAILRLEGAGQSRPNGGFRGGILALQSQTALSRRRQLHPLRPSGRANPIHLASNGYAHRLHFFSPRDARHAPTAHSS